MKNQQLLNHRQKQKEEADVLDCNQLAAAALHWCEEMNVVSGEASW